MSEPSTAEVLKNLPVQVTVGGQDFLWTQEAGLDPAAAMMLDPWIQGKAVRMRYPAARNGYSVDDLFQEGRVGALEATRTFNPHHECHCSFFGWAKFSILRRMLDVLRHGDLNVSKRDWDAMRTVSEFPQVCSLDSSPLPDGSLTLKDLLADPSTPDPGMFDARDHILEALSSLGHRDRDVLLRRSGFLNPDGQVDTFEAIANDWSLTRQRVQQIEKKAQMRLRCAMARRGITQW